MSKDKQGIFGRIANKAKAALTSKQNNPEPAPQPPAIKLTPLREAMLNNLSLEDIQTICIQLQLDGSSLEGGKGRKISTLMQLCERRKKLEPLLQSCQKLYPNVDWQKEW